MRLTIHIKKVKFDFFKGCRKSAHPGATYAVTPIGPKSAVMM